jgi:CspA family cold shock protein
MITGLVEWYNPTKRFGFILPDDGGPAVFVHISALERAALPTLSKGQRVCYNLAHNNDKRCATDLIDILELTNCFQNRLITPHVDRLLKRLQPTFEPSIDQNEHPSPIFASASRPMIEPLAPSAPTYDQQGSAAAGASGQLEEQAEPVQDIVLNENAVLISLRHGRKTVEKQIKAMLALVELLLELRPGDAASHRSLCAKLREEKHVNRSESCVLADIHTLEARCGPLFQRHSKGLSSTLLPGTKQSLKSVKVILERQCKMWGHSSDH